MTNYMSNNIARCYYKHKSKFMKPFQVCHYYGKLGHIEPLCYKLYGRPFYPYKQQSTKQTPINDHAQQVCRVKQTTTINISNTSLREFSREDWYFDSGCSIHITKEVNYLKEVKPTLTTMILWVMVLSEIYGKGKLVYPGLPNLEDVLLVKGMTANSLVSVRCVTGIFVSTSLVLNALS